VRIWQIPSDQGDQPTGRFPIPALLPWNFPRHRVPLRARNRCNSRKSWSVTSARRLPCGVCNA